MEGPGALQALRSQHFSILMHFVSKFLEALGLLWHTVWAVPEDLRFGGIDQCALQSRGIGMFLVIPSDSAKPRFVACWEAWSQKK